MGVGLTEVDTNWTQKPDTNPARLPILIVRVGFLYSFCQRHAADPLPPDRQSVPSPSDNRSLRLHIPFTGSPYCSLVRVYAIIGPPSARW